LHQKLDSRSGERSSGPTASTAPDGGVIPLGSLIQLWPGIRDGHRWEMHLRLQGAQ
jgi:hypothetical protein